jgi:lipopolysaccharide transport system ATP-binding protein
MGVVIYGTNTSLVNMKLHNLEQGQQLTASFQLPCFLNKGVYTVTIGIHSEEGMSYDWMDEIMILEVTNYKVCDGLVDLNSRVKITQVESTFIETGC